MIEHTRNARVEVPTDVEGLTQELLGLAVILLALVALFLWSGYPLVW